LDLLNIEFSLFSNIFPQPLTIWLSYFSEPKKLTHGIQVLQLLAIGALLQEGDLFIVIFIPANFFSADNRLGTEAPFLMDPVNLAMVLRELPLFDLVAIAMVDYVRHPPKTFVPVKCL
jgi:hypothetical protein